MVTVGKQRAVGKIMPGTMSEWPSRLALAERLENGPVRDAAQRQRDEEFGADAAHQQTLFALPDTAAVTTTTAIAIAIID